VKFFPAVLLILGGDLSTKHLLKEFIMANCDSPECLQALTRLQEARNGFSNAVSEVMATCDPECWNLVDFDQPECPLKEKG
jgi:hypothetical protein